MIYEIRFYGWRLTVCESCHGELERTHKIYFKPLLDEKGIVALVKNECEFLLSDECESIQNRRWVI